MAKPKSARGSCTAVTRPPGRKFNLAKIDADEEGGLDKDQAKELTAKNLERLEELQSRLYADSRRSLLIVLQAMDTAGKDSTIKSVMGAFNPQGVMVTPFKAPTEEELAHDFLWRVHRWAPRKGMVGIFNRSHYEDVLVVRVHKLVEAKVWKGRYEQINHFEKLLSDAGTVIVKFFLHISKGEQLERLQSRQSERQKHWKFSTADLAERRYWEDYQQAYEDALSRCNTAHAPWHVVPANHKWYRNLVVSQVLVERLEELKLEYPAAAEDVEKLVIV